jgi:hypothetical protein
VRLDEWLPLLTTGKIFSLQFPPHKASVSESLTTAQLLQVVAHPDHLELIFQLISVEEITRLPVAPIPPRLNPSHPLVRLSGKKFSRRFDDRER